MIKWILDYLAPELKEEAEARDRREYEEKRRMKRLLYDKHPPDLCDEYATQNVNELMEHIYKDANARERRKINQKMAEEEAKYTEATRAQMKIEKKNN